MSELKPKRNWDPTLSGQPVGLSKETSLVPIRIPMNQEPIAKGIWKVAGMPSRHVRDMIWVDRKSREEKSGILFHQTIERVVRVQEPVLRPLSKAELFQLYPVQVQKLSACCDQLNAFFRQIAQANTKYKNMLTAPQQQADAGRQYVERTKANIQFHSPGGVQSAELAVQTAPKIHEAMFVALSQATRQLVRQMFEGLDKLAQAEMIGRIHWLSNEVCRFSFYDWTVEEEQIGQRTSSTMQGFLEEVRTERDMRQTIRHGIEIHDMINATPLDPHDARVRKPQRVEKLIRAIPAFLLPHVQVIHGEEIFRQVFETIISSQVHTDTDIKLVDRTPVYNIDPCLVLGDLVLTGWNNDER